MKSIYLILLVSFPLVASGQGVMTADKAEIRIGDQVKVTVRTDLSNGREWINADRVWPEFLKGIEVVAGPEWNRDNPAASIATWTISIFDTGVVRIPSLIMVMQQQGQVDTQYTNDIPIKVLAVEPDSTGLEEIKDIYPEPFNPGYYKKYIPHALVFLLAVVGLILWLRQRKSKHVVPEAAPVPLLPHEWAGKALDELAGKKLWQRGEVKEHYTALMDILREYLERRFGIHAREQTSDEILMQLRLQELSPRLLADTAELLSIADLIKFAKADPGMNIHADTIERVRVFVAETTSSFFQSTPGVPKSAGDEAAE
jgi:hypothetical protein